MKSRKEDPGNFSPDAQYRQQSLNAVIQVQHVLDDIGNTYRNQYRDQRQSVPDVFIYNLLREESEAHVFLPFVHQQIQEAVNTYALRTSMPVEVPLYYPKLLILDDWMTEHLLGNDGTVVAKNLYDYGGVGVSLSRLIDRLSQSDTREDVRAVWNLIGMTYLRHLAEINRAYKYMSDDIFQLGSSEYINYDRPSTDGERVSLEEVYTQKGYEVFGFIFSYVHTDTGAFPDSEADVDTHQDGALYFRTQDYEAEDERLQGDISSSKTPNMFDEDIPEQTNSDRTYDPLVSRVFSWLAKIETLSDYDYQESVFMSDSVRAYTDEDIRRTYELLPPVTITRTFVPEADELFVHIDDERGYLKPYRIVNEEPQTEEEYTQRILDAFVFLDPNCLYGYQIFQIYPYRLTQAVQEYTNDKTLLKKVRKLERIWNDPYPIHRIQELRALYMTLQRKMKYRIDHT
jgi:hypothetical protein